MEFSRQEHWSELPFSSPGIFPTQGLNPQSVCISRQILLPLHHLGSCYIGVEWAPDPNVFEDKIFKEMTKIRSLE